MMKTKTFSIFTVLLLAVIMVPAALADTDIIKQLEAQITELDARYGLDPIPKLTDEQWDQYDKEWQTLESEKQPYYDQLEELDKKYELVLAEIQKLDEKGHAISEKFGFQTQYPELTEEEWMMYDVEVKALYDEMDSQWQIIDAQYDAQYNAQYDAKLIEIHAEFGITQPATYNENPQFFEELNKMIKSTGIPVEDMCKGDMSTAQKEYAYQQMEDNAPLIKTVYEKYGYEFSVTTAEEFAELDKKLSVLDETCD